MILQTAQENTKNVFLEKYCSSMYICIIKAIVSLDNILHSILQHALKCITAFGEFLAPMSKANYVVWQAET